MPEQDQLVADILTYLLQMPESEDSLEGVAAWRQLDLPATRSALADAVNRQLLVVQRTSDGRTLYRLNPEKRAEVQRMAGCSPAPGRRRSRYR